MKISTKMDLISYKRFRAVVLLSLMVIGATQGLIDKPGLGVAAILVAMALLRWGRSKVTDVLTDERTEKISTKAAYTVFSGLLYVGAFSYLALEIAALRFPELALPSDVLGVLVSIVYLAYFIMYKYYQGRLR